MSSPMPKPGELEHLLEEFSFKLEDYKRKFNPFFSQVSLELKDKVDLMRATIEKYAHYDREHQLRHLLDSHQVKQEISSIHNEIEGIHQRIENLEQIYKLGKYLK